VRILLAEDDVQLRDTVARGLRQRAFAVDAVGDGETALVEAASTDYDVLVLDVGLPHKSGLALCRELRSRGSRVPILLLTARDTVADRVAGLDAGADDYLIKPFAFAELCARLRALLRRDRRVVDNEVQVADLVIDTRQRTARRGARQLDLTPTEFAVLEYLAQHAGRVVSRTEIVAHVWDDNHDPSSNAIDVYMSRIRRKVDGGESSALIVVRRGAGCMLIDPRSVTGGDGGP
jgi:two-component system copper resistance phosphate regulon response regulator CusR